jgi:hypothetical protein
MKVEVSYALTEWPLIATGPLIEAFDKSAVVGRDNMSVEALMRGKSLLASAVGLVFAYCRSCAGI